jgi:hypothetical protein
VIVVIVAAAIAGGAIFVGIDFVSAVLIAVPFIIVVLVAGPRRERQARANEQNL